MRVVAIATVRNEIDIVEAWVRHTAALADFVVVTDNGSTDGTLEILRELVKEGLPLEVVEDPSLGYHQAERMTRLYREFAWGRFRADWVLALDGDEFVLPSQNGTIIPDEVCAGRPLATALIEYIPNDGEVQAEINPVLRIRRRACANSRAARKVFVPGSCAADAECTIAPGNHHLLHRGQPVMAVAASRPLLAHFPVRSPGQYLSKNATISLQLLGTPNHAPSWGLHNHAPFALLKQDPEAFCRNYRALAFNRDPARPFDTIDEPIDYRGGPLKYTPQIGDVTRGWLSVLHLAESFARRCGEPPALAAPAAEMLHRLAEETRERLQQSWTWRVGRLIVGPFASLRRLFKKKKQPSNTAMASASRTDAA